MTKISRLRVKGLSRPSRVNTYARVRIFFKDRESLKRAVEVQTAEETGGKGRLTVLSSEEDTVKPLKTEFTDCFPGKVSNEYCYSKVCIPMIANVLKGFKALLIAYGQTGSGKTFSLLGAKGPGELGLLPRTIEEFIKNDAVLEVKMKAFEAYSTTLNKIPLYDLFDAVNSFKFTPFTKPSDDPKENKAAEYAWVQKKSLAAKALWGSKQGRTGFNTLKEGNERVVATVEDGFRLVHEAHDASHFAKTGKNPESSRGHTVYILILKIKNPEGEDYNPVQTEFVVVDLAGSEGGSTLEALPDGPDKTARFLEGGVINFGLTSLKDMFTEMRKKGQLGASQGNGLRKLLYPFVTSNTMMSIVFTLSPSVDNVMPTRATMKFARDACKLKTKPVAGTSRKNWKKMYEKLKTVLDEKTALLEQYEQVIKEAHELVTPVAESEMGADAQLIVSNLQAAYSDHVERLYFLFKEYDISQFLSDETLKHGEEVIQNLRDEYRDKLVTLYNQHSIEDGPKPEEIIETQLECGVDMEHWFENFKLNFQNKISREKDSVKLLLEDQDIPKTFSEKRAISVRFQEMEKEEIIKEYSISKNNSGTLEVPTANLRRRKTIAWQQTSRNLIELRKTHTHRAKQTMTNLLEFDDSESDSEPDSEELMNQLANQMSDEEPDSMELAFGFEDIDYTGPPPWFEALQSEAKEFIEKMIAKNLSQGQLPDSSRLALKNSYDLYESQIDELITYCMMKQGEAHDHKVMNDFQTEIGKEGVGFSELESWLEMQNKIVQLEAQLSLKLEEEFRSLSFQPEKKPPDPQPSKVHRQFQGKPTFSPKTPERRIFVSPVNTDIIPDYNRGIMSVPTPVSVETLAPESPSEHERKSSVPCFLPQTPSPTKNPCSIPASISQADFSSLLSMAYGICDSLGADTVVE